jgi:hypothetical protein
LWAERWGKRLSSQPVNQASTAVTPALKLTTAEKHLVRLVLNDVEVRKQALAKLQEAEYQWLPTANLFQVMSELEKESTKWDFSDLLEATREEPTTHNLLLEISSEEKPWNEIAPESVGGCLQALRLVSIDRRLQDLASEAFVAQRDNDIERRDRLSLEQIALTRLRNSLVHPQ